jgi:hypothetical protein
MYAAIDADPVGETKKLLREGDAFGTSYEDRAVRGLLRVIKERDAEVERLTKERDRREGHIRVVLSERITVTRHDEMFVVQVANYADPKKTSSVQRAFLGCDEITSVMTWIPRALSQVAIPGEGGTTEGQANG